MQRGYFARLVRDLASRMAAAALLLSGCVTMPNYNTVRQQQQAAAALRAGGGSA